MTVIITDIKYKMSLSIIRDLYNNGFNIVACQSKDDDVPLGFYSNGVTATHSLSNIDYNPNLYIKELHKICTDIYSKDRKKPVLIPVGANTTSLLSIKENQEEFSKVANFLIPEKELLDNLNDKDWTSNLANSLDIPVPFSYSITDTPSFPCVVKPLCGEKLGLKAKDRYKIVKDLDSLINAHSHFLSLEGVSPVIQQYIKGVGYGCSILAINGKIINSISHKRLREYPISGGPSTCSITVTEPILLENATRIIESTNYSGIAMIEFKKGNDGKFYFLEINPRVWGTYPLTRVSKSSFTLDWASCAMGIIPKKINKPIIGKKMIYAPTDAMAMVSNIKNGKYTKGLASFFDIFNPLIKDGTLEIADYKASKEYISSIIKKKGKR